MWFKQKTVCERQGHSWNERGGFSDGNGGTIIRPLNGSCCLKCPAIYKSPPPPPVLSSDRIQALQYLLGNYNKLKKISAQYPTFGTVGTCPIEISYERTLDQEIQRLWDAL